MSIDRAPDVAQILQDRAQKAFKKKIPDDIIQYCAEISSSEHGDARRVLDLLRVAGELSDGVKITKKDVAIAGGKGASLGEMTRAKIVVPPGFVVIASAFDRFLLETDLLQDIEAQLKKVN